MHLRENKGPEAKVQESICNYLTLRGWFVGETHGNMYQKGLPDLFCTHLDYGHRWVEVKLPNMAGSKFTAAQLETFPKLCSNGSGVWILTAATEYEYKKLWQPPNWTQYHFLLKRQCR